MTKKLEELLNLPESQEIVKEDEKNERVKEKQVARDNAPTENLFRDIDDFDKIAKALPQVKGLGDKSDSELDALAQRATDAYDDLMDLGMNVDPRYSARVFEVASSMLKNAIDAKSSKIDKKLKMIELQLKKQKLDQDGAKNSGEGESGTIDGEGYLVTDRNSLLEKIRNMK